MHQKGRLSGVVADTREPGSHGSSAAHAVCSVRCGHREGGGILRSYVVSSDCLQGRVQEDVSSHGLTRCIEAASSVQIHDQALLPFV